MKVMAQCVAATMVALLLAVGAAAPPVHAQQLRRGTLSGTIVSRSVDVVPGGPITIFTTPSDSFFVLTEVCTDAQGLRVSATGFGKIPTPNQACNEFPGIALPQKSTITVQGSGGSVTITGVLTFK